MGHSQQLQNDIRYAKWIYEGSTVVFSASGIVERGDGIL